jgi:hypothetical protein
MTAAAAVTQPLGAVAKKSAIGKASGRSTTGQAYLVFWESARVAFRAPSGTLF